MKEQQQGMQDEPGWKVLGDQIKKEDTLAPGGTGLQEVYVIPYQITAGAAKGHTGSVRLPPDDYTPDNVRQAIDDAVRTTHDVASLSSGNA